MDNRVYTAINKLIKINREHKCLIESQVAKIGIHRTQHRILMYVSKNGSLPSQKKLAEYFEITPAAITGAVQKLEKEGYIKRKLGSDNRFNEITVTEKGKEIVEKTKELFNAIDDALFEGFSDDEIDVFSEYLDRIRNNLKEETKHEKMV